MNIWKFTVDPREEFDSLTLQDRAKVIELCIGKGYCLTLIAHMMKVSVQTISRVVDSYLPPTTPHGLKLIMTLESKNY